MSSFFDQIHNQPKLNNVTPNKEKPKKQPEKKSIHTFLKNDRFFIKDLYGLKEYGTVLYDRHARDPSGYKKHTYKVKWDIDNEKKDDTIYGHLFNMIPT